jgi:adenylate cyclase
MERIGYMAGHERYSPETVTEVWRTYLNTGDLPDNVPVPWYLSRRLRAIYSRMPQNPRCRLCAYPFKGVGGAVMRHILGVVPSRLNPQICNHCEQFAERYNGGAEVEISILFADVRGSTTLAESMNPTEFSRLINRFYSAATGVLFTCNGMVEKLIGDAVTGFFTSGLAGPNHPRAAVEAAREILRVTGHDRPEGPWIQVGIGVHTGTAYVGAVTSERGSTDIAVLGDAANVGARLAALAAPGEIHISRPTAQAAGLSPEGVEIRHQALKGRSEPVEVWVLSSAKVQIEL